MLQGYMAETGAKYQSGYTRAITQRSRPLTTPSFEPVATFVHQAPPLLRHPRPPALGHLGTALSSVILGLDPRIQPTCVRTVRGLLACPIVPRAADAALLDSCDKLRNDGGEMVA
jgi:hypothetical protein